MRLKQRAKVLSGFSNMTPMVDVVFILLLFFMLSSSFVVHSGIKIKLPAASTKETEREAKLNITITRNKRIFLNGKKTRLKELFQTIQNSIDTKSEKTLFIKADANVCHGLVVEVMDIAKRAGIERLAIATQPRNTD